MTEQVKEIKLDISFESMKINYILLDQCKDNFVYVIIARNSHLGIFNKKDSSFTISRFKFSNNFLFDEYHWDTGEPYGTVKPLLEITSAPNFSNEEEKLRFLNDLNKNMRATIIALNNEFYTNENKPYMLLKE